MYRRTHKANQTTGPMISVLIPVRNEESHIGACLRSLINQTYENYEIIVLDDDSTDSTWDIICSYAKRSNRITAVKGNPLLSGWNGKNYALHQLAELARGQYYLFVDADTIHKPDSLSFAYTNLKENKVDMVSGYPKQESLSISSQIVVTAMHFNMLFLTPLWLQIRSSNPLFAFAIGQYIFVRAETFHAVNGFETIKNVITDDIHLARIILSHGHPQIFLDIGSVVSCRMYSSFRSSFRGISRSIIDFFDKKLIIPLFAVPLVIVFIISPTFVLLYQIATHATVSLILLLGVTLSYAAWAQTMIFLRYSAKTILFFCPTMILIVIMFIRGFLITVNGKGYVWKNRIVK